MLEASEPTEPPLASDSPETSSASATARHHYHRRRNGAVARLPHQIQEKLNLALLDNATYLQAIQALGDDGKHLTEDHLRSWIKFGGFDAWLEHYELKCTLADTRSQASDLNRDKPASDVQDAGRAVASGQIYELLRLYNPTAFAAAAAEKPEIYLRLVTSLARLSEAESVCAHRRVQQALAELKLDKPQAFDSARMYTGEQLQEILRRIKIL